MADNQTDDAGDDSDEFEREPVPEKALLGFKSFVGQYAGEHCAGTELMIGPLFVAGGVGARDLIVGLLVGNLLAVLSWTFLTAPIATRARLTLYYQLEKICGRSLVTLYNLANGVMFCFLAGAMITVSATAVGAMTQGTRLEFEMPRLEDVYPNSAGWVVAALVMGLLVAVVAAYGYKFVARVANIAAPWMVLVFLAFGLVGLKQFIDATDAKVDSAAALWNLFETHIWKGVEPPPDRVWLKVWHIMFFAWFCNMAMHVGMSDLSVFRYARHTWYGLATASGMYVGHFMAWMSAAILYALQLHKDPSNTSVLPGPLAYEACGIAGLICVIVAGWTTANPTIYRAGLAFQAIMPSVSRFKVTLVTGLIATVAGMFPAIAMKLLDFVLLYGMLLMPMGAVVFVDFYLIRKFGLQSNYAELSRKHFNWAAGLTWFVTLGACTFLVQYQSIQPWLVEHGLNLLPAGYKGMQIYFVSLPGWFVAAVLYIVLSKLYQRKVHGA